MKQYRKTQKGNPHKLTIKQHVFPVKSIQRFCNESGKVYVYRFNERKSFPKSPDDAIFCAKRVWGHGDEHGYMKLIEDKYQQLADEIMNNGKILFDNAENDIITDFFILLHLRSLYNKIPVEDIKLNGIEGDNLSIDMQEVCEKKHVSYIQSDSTVPGHLFNGLQIQLAIMHFKNTMKNTKWGLIRALEGEFIVPDYFLLKVIPLTPILCLIADNSTGCIPKNQVSSINKSLIDNCKEYYFRK